MTFKEAMRHIGAGKLFPLYVLYGSDVQLIEELAERLADAALPKEERSLHLTRFSLLEQPLDAVLDEVQTYSLLSSRRVVVAQHAHFLTAAAARDKLEHNLERLIRYALSPVPENLLILIAPAAKLDERKKVVKTLLAHAQVVRCEPLKETEYMQWLAARAKEMGLVFEGQALERLYQRVGAQLGMLRQELDKIKQYAGDRPVTAEMVDLLVPRSLEENVFELLDAVVGRNLDRALRIYYDLLAKREEPLRLMALLASQLRLLLHMHHLYTKGLGTNSIAQRLGQNPYRVRNAYSWMPKVDRQWLMSCLSRLAQLDAEVKSSQIDKEKGLEQFLIQSCYVR